MKYQGQTVAWRELDKNDKDYRINPKLTQAEIDKKQASLQTPAQKIAASQADVNSKRKVADRNQAILNRNDPEYKNDGAHSKPTLAEIEQNDPAKYDRVVVTMPDGSERVILRSELANE